jgi:hypothetical protein
VTHSTGERGVAIILVILVIAFLSALGMGLMLAVFMDRLASGNLSGSVAMLYAADAGIELAARDLARLEDWDAALSGSLRSTFTDGSTTGVRALAGGGVVDLSAATNWLNCGKASACTAAQMDASSQERPWGPNNPRWVLYAFGPMPNLVQLSRPAMCYLAVWIADDTRETDGQPLADGAPGDAGHGIVRVRAETFGVAGSRRTVEAEVARVCRPGGAGNCRPGIRVQSWQELRQPIP